MTIPTVQKSTPAPMLDLLIIINKLVIKAFMAESKEAFQFILLNDTVHTIKYDRAFLWSIGEGEPELLGISGQVVFNKNAPLFIPWRRLTHEIQHDKSQELHEELFADKEAWHQVKGKASKILWLTIYQTNKPALGLWLELGDEFQGKTISPDFLSLLQSTLLLGYGAAYDKYQSRWKKVPKEWKKQALKYGWIGLVFILLAVRIPVRIAAPCEIVPKDPIYVTAPLEGIIKEIVVKPGETVKKDQLLAEYDKRVPLENLKAAKKQVQVNQSQVDRAQTLGLSDPKALAELAILSLKLQKEKISLDLAEYQASLLDIKAQDPGVVIMESPEEWRGKPVKVGEKIMVLGTPEHSKVRLWLPESDNIPLDFNRPIKIFLNVEPEHTYYAQLNYIANETTLHDNYIPSFVADADWQESPEEIKLGLMGTAVLYGERVSLIYFLLRKPLLTIRNLLDY